MDHHCRRGAHGWTHVASIETTSRRTTVSETFMRRVIRESRPASFPVIAAWGRSYRDVVTRREQDLSSGGSRRPVPRP